jgi:hypothetical protein
MGSLSVARRLPPVLVALALVAVGVIAGALPQAASSSPTVPTFAICNTMPPITLADYNQCVTNVENAVSDDVANNVASYGDKVDQPAPAYEACWESVTDPAYNAMERGAATLPTAALSGCGYSGNGGTTVVRL